MAGRRLRLHHRIVLPFGVLSVVVAAVTAYTALAVTSQALRARVEAQISDAATVLSQNDFALNPSVLRSAKAISGADVITYTDGGEVLATTLDPARALALSRAVPASTPGTSLNAVVLWDRCDTPCAMAYHRVRGHPDTVVAVMTTTTELMTVTRTVTRTILAAAGVSVMVMLLLSQVFARWVTRPIDALVQFARDVAAGDSSVRAPAGDDDVGLLGAAFNSMLDRLERSSEALVRSEKLALAGLFAARVAHDIRNPLSSIKMQTQLLQVRLRGASDPESAIGLEAVQRDILQVESVVRDLLELARPGDLRLAPLRIEGIVADALEQSMAHLRYRNIDVRHAFESGAPSVPIDEARFKQAILNIINNAADAMPAGGTLSAATRMESSSGMLVLEICDDGEGISPELLPRIFDPFVSSKREGIGLGLVNAKAVIDLHGGTIEVAPRAPRGTRVTIRLPVEERRNG